jgi:hypothetical protein
MADYPLRYLVKEKGCGSKNDSWLKPEGPLT